MIADHFEHEVERLKDLLVPYLCERTGLSAQQVILVLDANDAFWESQPSVIANLVIFQMPDDGEEEV